MRRFFHPLLLSMALLGAAEVLSGCDSESKNADVKTAEDAIGIQPEKSKEQKTVGTTRDLMVVKDTKVIDNKTGQTISEKKESTPVTITEETREKTNLDVKVGDTKLSETGAKPVPK